MRQVLHIVFLSQNKLDVHNTNLLTLRSFDNHNPSAAKEKDELARVARKRWGFPLLLFYNFDQITSAKSGANFFHDLQKAATWKKKKATGELKYECHI